MALGGGNGLGQVISYEGQGEAGPSSKIAGVDGLCPGGDNGAKAGAVQTKDHIHESFHFVGAVDMRLQKRWIGHRSQRGEIYVPEAVGAIAVADDVGSVIFDEADGVGGENGGVEVIAHRLLVVTRGVRFEAVAGAASISDDLGGAGGK